MGGANFVTRSGLRAEGGGEFFFLAYSERVCGDECTEHDRGGRGLSE